MGYLVINGHRSKVPLSTWGVLELHQNSFLGSSWDLYGAIKRTGPPRSGKFSLNRHSIGLRKVLSSRPASGPNVHLAHFGPTWAFTSLLTLFQCVCVFLPLGFVAMLKGKRGLPKLAKIICS